MPLAPVATAQTTPPNIVVIFADDMRFDLMDDMPVLQAQLVAKGRSFKPPLLLGAHERRVAASERTAA